MIMQNVQYIMRFPIKIPSKSVAKSMEWFTAPYIALQVIQNLWNIQSFKFSSMYMPQ